MPPTGGIPSERSSDIGEPPSERLDAVRPIISPSRREELAPLIGAPAPPPRPGPEAGEQAGFPGAGDPTRRHMDLRGAGEPASEPADPAPLRGR
jgi:hypothetical protein